MSPSGRQPGQSPEFPRVLVVSGNPFNRATNNGTTLSSLFLGWPKDRLAQLYLPSATPITPEFDVCDRIWSFTPAGPRQVRASAAVPGLAGPRRRLVGAISDARVRRVALPVRELLYGAVPWRGRGARAIDKFRPAIVFSTLGSLALVRLASRMQKRYRAALVPFITDDWPTTEYRGAIFSNRLRRYLAEGWHEILGRATVRMVISPAMARAYTERYGGHFLPFTQLVDAERFDPAPTPPRTTVRLVYAGQLGLDRWKSLKRIGDALRRLDSAGLRGELLVYTIRDHVASYGRLLHEPPIVRVEGSLTSAELPVAYREADVLVHAESFSPELAEYTRYSMSTKLTEYMMAGRCIFAFGPPQGSIRYVVDEKVGVGVFEDSDEQLMAQLDAVLRDRRLREEYGRRGRSCAIEKHEASAQRERFRKALCTAAWLEREDGNDAPR